ncbi:MAG: hypothetical protein HYS21_03525 [Deltaproteobacteria bacterium]|nr:hypothetical protein [Deltaproteobacteria bacterium]
MKARLEKIFKGAGENRKLSVGFVIIFFLSALIVFRTVYRLHKGVQEEIEIKQENLNILASSIEKSVDSVDVSSGESLRELEKGIIAAEKSSIAGAVLQKTFKTIASKNHVTVISERPLKPIEAGEYLKVPIEFKLKTGLSGLSILLQDLRSSSLMIGLSSISIRTIEGGLFDITLVIEGVMRR